MFFSHFPAIGRTRSKPQRSYDRRDVDLIYRLPNLPASPRVLLHAHPSCSVLGVHVLRWLLVAGAFLFASGCVMIRGYPDRSGDIGADLKSLEQYFAPATIQAANNQTVEADRRRLRDDIVNGQLRAMDLHFALFEQEMAREGVLINVGTDWAVLGLSGAGTIVPTAGTKAILAAISGGLTGAKGSVDKNVFYEKTMPVLLGKMEALRKEQLVAIRTGLNLPTSSYPLNQALIDVENYYKAGTIPGAILGIAESSGATAADAEKNLKNLIVLKYNAEGPTRPLRDRINRWLDSDPGKNVPLLRDWLRKQKPPITLSPGSWVESQQTTAEELQKAINDPTLKISE